MTQAVLLDIEGTIGDIAFVREVLFPFARARIADVLKARWSDPEIAQTVQAACLSSTAELSTPAEAAQQFLSWMDEDRKITPLKTLQGIIWREGYRGGELKAHLYLDAVEAMRVWHRRGLRLFIYSSGSIEAQKLYLAHSIAGDLTPLIDNYFDTTSGAKGEPGSYTKIASTMGIPAAEITFFSDAPTETTAATDAGFGVYRVNRAKPFSFDELDGETPVIGSFVPVIERVGG